MCTDLSPSTSSQLKEIVDAVVPLSPSRPDSDIGMRAILDLASTTGTILTGAARALMCGPYCPVTVTITTAAQGSSLNIPDEGQVASDFIVLYYATNLRQSVVSAWKLCEHGSKAVKAPHGGLIIIVHPDGQVVNLDTNTNGIWLVDPSSQFSVSLFGVLSREEYDFIDVANIYCMTAMNIRN